LLVGCKATVINVVVSAAAAPIGFKLDPVAQATQRSISFRTALMLPMSVF
jgi:hypothetical protein